MLRCIEAVLAACCGAIVQFKLTHTEWQHHFIHTSLKGVMLRTTFSTVGHLNSVQLTIDTKYNHSMPLRVKGHKVMASDF